MTTIPFRQPDARGVDYCLMHPDENVRIVYPLHIPMTPITLATSALRLIYGDGISDNDQELLVRAALSLHVVDRDCKPEYKMTKVPHKPADLILFLAQANVTQFCLNVVEGSIELSSNKTRTSIRCTLVEFNEVAELNLVHGDPRGRVRMLDGCEAAASEWYSYQEYLRLKAKFGDVQRRAVLKAVIQGWNAAPGAPPGWKPERDGECGVLPIRVTMRDHGTAVQHVESAWEPTPDELRILNEGGLIILRVIGWQPPVALYVERRATDAE